MQALVNILAFLSASALGLTAGALLSEGAILVPFWRSLAPPAFLGWYRQHAALLLNFFGPLEVAAALLTVAAAILSWIHQSTGRQLLALSAFLAVAVLAVFPLYFQRVNASFASGTIDADRVAEELRRWSSWHWVRTIIATAAFLCALAA